MKYLKYFPWLAKIKGLENQIFDKDSIPFFLIVEIVVEVNKLSDYNPGLVKGHYFLLKFLKNIYV